VIGSEIKYYADAAASFCYIFILLQHLFCKALIIARVHHPPVSSFLYLEGEAVLLPLCRCNFNTFEALAFCV